MVKDFFFRKLWENRLFYGLWLDFLRNGVFGLMGLAVHELFFIGYSCNYDKLGFYFLLVTLLLFLISGDFFFLWEWGLFNDGLRSKEVAFN